MQITRNSLYLTLEKGAHLLGAMILMVLVARMLGEGALSGYAYAMGLTAFFVPILDAGLNNRIIRTVAENGPEATRASGDAVSYRLTVALPVLVTMILCTVLSPESRGLLAVVALVGASTVVMGLGDSFNSVIKGRQCSEFSALLVFGMNTVLVLGSFWAMSLGMGLTALGACYLVSRSLYLGAGVCTVQIIARAHRASFGLGISRQHVLEGIFHLPAVYFLGNLLHIGYITTYLNSDPIQSDAYAVGYRVAAALFILTGASMEAILPALTVGQGNSDNFRKTVKKLFWSHATVSLLGVAVVHVLAARIVPLVLGDAFAAAEGPIRLIALCVPVFTVCALAHTVLLACGQQKVATIWMLALLITGAVLGFVGAAFWGAVGTALASVMTACIFGVVLWEIVRRQIRKD